MKVNRHPFWGTWRFAETQVLFSLAPVLPRQKSWTFRHVEVQIAKSHVRFDRDDVFVRRHVVQGVVNTRIDGVPSYLQRGEDNR